MSAKFYALSLVACAGLGLANPQAAQAFSPAHVDRLAQTLERQTEELLREVNQHFRATPRYRHLADDVADMLRLARHMHEIAHRAGSIGHLRRDVEDFDRSFHHVEGLVRNMAVSGRLDRHTLDHFRASLNDVERTLHHLRSDLEDVHAPHISGHGGYVAPTYVAPTYVVPAPTYVTPGYATGGFGLRIPLGDRGSFSLRIPIR